MAGGDESGRECKGESEVLAGAEGTSATGVVFWAGIEVVTAVSRKEERLEDERGLLEEVEAVPVVVLVRVELVVVVV